jgi:transposase
VIRRLLTDAIFWIVRTGTPWRDLPADLGHWNSVFRQFRRWTASGLWDVMLEPGPMVAATPTCCG